MEKINPEQWQKIEIKVNDAEITERKKGQYSIEITEIPKDFVSLTPSTQSTTSCLPLSIQINTSVSNRNISQKVRSSSTRLFCNQRTTPVLVLHSGCA